jgi:uncharacterized membrane protein
MARLPLRRAALVLLIAAVVLLPTGTVGQGDGGPWPDGPGVIGAIGWYGFLLCVLLLLVVGVIALARAIMARSGARSGGASSA